MRTSNQTSYVAACVLSCFLAALRAEPKLLAQAAAIAKAAPVQQATRLDVMQTTGRVDIPRFSNAFHLGEDNELQLTLKGPPADHIFLMQRLVDASDGASPWIAGGDTEVKLGRNKGGQSYVNFVPLRPGKLEVQVNVFFSDGGFEVARAELDVIADKPPLRLEDTSVLRLDLSEQGRRHFLRISAIYAGIKEPLPLKVGQAQLRVVMSKEAPPIEFDPKTMEVRALRIGEALIETQYAGLSGTTCVHVLESRDQYNRSDCKELRGDGVANSQEITRPYESKLPYSPTDYRRGRFLADERVDVVSPTQPLHIASDNPITFRLRGPEVARMECHSTAGDPCSAWRGQWSREGLPLEKSADGTGTVNVFPMGFGKQELTFFILYVDGGVALKKVSVDVDAGTAKPNSIGPWCDRAVPDYNAPVELLAPKDGKADFPGDTTIFPYACYDGIRSPVSLPIAAVQYQVRSEENESPIELDVATGKVKALRPGQALVQQSFAGLTRDTCIVVVKRGEPDASNCRGMRTKFGTPLPQPKVRVKAPDLEDEPDPIATPGRMGGMISLAGPPPEIPTVDAITGARLSPDVRDRFHADDRLQVLQKGYVADLGQPGRLPIRLTGPAVLSVSIEQELVRYSARFGALQYEEPASMEERNAGRIGRAADGSRYLHILPLRPGTSEFRVRILFVDGGVATRLIQLPVRLPPGLSPQLSNGLEDSMRDFSREVRTLHVTPGNTRNLFSFLSFAGQAKRIALNPEEIQYSVRNAGSDPVIQLDAKTGLITGLRAGHALIKSRYMGAENEICVVVLKDMAEEDKWGCQELRGEN